MRLRAATVAQGKAVVRLSAIMPPDAPRPSGLKSLAVRVDLPNGGLDLTMTLEHDAPDQAVTSEQQLRDQFELLRRQLRPLAMDPYFDGMIVAAQGTRVVVTVTLGREQCERLADLLTRLAPLLQRQFLPEGS